MRTRRLGNASKLESLGRVGLRLLLMSCHNEQPPVDFDATQSRIVPIRAFCTDVKTYDDFHLWADSSWSDPAGHAEH